MFFQFMSCALLVAKFAGLKDEVKDICHICVGTTKADNEQEIHLGESGHLVKEVDAAVSLGVFEENTT